MKISLILREKKNKTKTYFQNMLHWNSFDPLMLSFYCKTEESSLSASSIVVGFQKFAHYPSF